jgi:hypothetical protein
MTYSAEISRANPMCFLFLIDQSGSMDRPIQGAGRKKADVVADALNRLLQTLVYRCARGEEILDRYFIGVIGYSDRVALALGGDLAGRGLVPVSEIGNHPLRIETRTKKVDDGAGGVLEQTVKFPVWVEPRYQGKTRMCEAFTMAREMVLDFIQNCPSCFPPIVINITDGQATDGNPEAPARTLRQVASEDGHLLLFNLHISSQAERPVQFPSGEEQVPQDDFARLLFRISSVLPDAMLRLARFEDIPLVPGARGFVFNADLVSVVQFLDIGTRVGRSA